jgi:hypothetical protein
MLLDKYLPEYHYREKHEMVINASPAKVYELVTKLDIGESWIIKTLLALRGLPSQLINKEQMHRTRFIELENLPQKEMIIGLIGQFWKPSGNLQLFKPEEFLSFDEKGFLKAVWNFDISEQSSSTTLLTTETRIQCLGDYAKRRFSMYWFVVRPFSGLMRKEMLKAMKRKSEHHRMTV